MACMDKNTTQCRRWGESECLNNPVSVMRDCPQMCGVCTTSCIDKHDSCKEWANMGECKGNNSDYVLKNCPQSCHVCHNLDKDEL